MILSFLIFSVLAFLIGFSLGMKAPKTTPKLKHERFDKELEVLKEEYENFLNYDGTEQ